MATKADDLLAQIKNFLKGLSDAEKKELKEMQFTATKRVAGTKEPSICFSLVASVPFARGKARKKR